MARLTALETYCLFVTLKMHFTVPTYDYFRYNGKSANVNLNSFMVRRDKKQFQKLCRTVDGVEMRDFIVANLAKGKLYAVDMTTDDAEENYREFVKRKQSFGYVFANELERLFASVECPADLFRKRDRAYPALINEYLSGNVSLETVCVLNEYVRFASRLDKRLGHDDVIWSKLRLLILKFTPFIEYDRDKIKNILRTAMEDLPRASKSS